MNRRKGNFASLSAEDLNTKEEVERWLTRGDTKRLEGLVLAGKAELLKGARSHHVKTRAFMKSLPLYSRGVDRFLSSVVQGDLEEVKSTCTYKNVIYATHPQTGATVVHLVIIWNKFDVLQFLLDKINRNILSSVDRDKRTPLHYAAVISSAESDQRFYEKLKELGADENVPDSEGFTPLHYLTNPDLVDFEKLKDKNAYPVKQSDELDILIVQDSKEKLQELILNGESWRLNNRKFPPGSEELARSLRALIRRVEAIHQAVKDGDAKSLKQFVDNRVLATARNAEGETPLHVAILNLNFPIAEYLVLVYPHCVSERNKQGRTPLHYAAFLDQTEKNRFYQLLISTGADKSLKDDLGNTAAFYFKKNGVAAKVLKSLQNPKKMSQTNPGFEKKTKAKSSVAIPTEAELKIWLKEKDFEPIRDMLNKGQRKVLRGWSKKYPELAQFLKENQEIIDNSVQERNVAKSTEEVSLDSNFGSQNHSEGYSLSEPNLNDDRLLTAAQIDEWLEEGDTENLEKVVLDGHIDLLRDKETEQPDSKEFLDALVQYQAKIDAIFKAVEEGDVRRVKNLVDRAALAKAKDRKGMTPLHKAVIHGQTDTIRFLLIKFPDTVNVCDREGRTPLHFAASDRNGGHYVKLLQKAGADAFIEDKCGHTPFYYQTNPERLNLQIIKDSAVMDQLMIGELPRPLLQDLEDDILDWLHTGNLGKLEEIVLNGYGDLLLGKAHEVEDRDVLNFLEILPQYQAKISSIHRSVQQGNLKEVKNLIDRKKLALCRDSKGASPLHNSVLYCQNDIVKYLLRNYPQAVNAQDHKKLTPLHYASAMKDGAYYKMLRKASADPDIPDGLGKTPKYYLHHRNELDLESMRLDSRAALRQALQHRVAPSYLESSIQQWLREGNVGKLEQLILSGCGDLLYDRTSQHPDASEFLEGLQEYLNKIDNIHRSVRNGNLKDLKDFLENKKKLAIARDKKGATPLHDAVLYEQSEVLRFLAEMFPLCLHSPDYNKRTALHYAAAARDGGHYYKILEKAGADTKAVDNEGHTPEYYLRNPGTIDLKAIRDRDKEIVVELDGYLSDGEERHLESRSSIDSAPTPLSHSADLAASNSDIVDMEESRRAFSEAFESKMSSLRLDERSLPSTENGMYLARTVGPALTKALAEVVIKRPADPLGYVADWLYRYHEDNIQRKNEVKGTAILSVIILTKLE